MPVRLVLCFVRRGANTELSEMKMQLEPMPDCIVFTTTADSSETVLLFEESLVGTFWLGSKFPKAKLDRDESDDDEEICTPPQKRAGWQLVH